MKKTVLGAALALGLACGLGAAGPVHAGPGDGLDRNAGAQGNGNFGGMHRGARAGSRAVMMRRHHHRMRRHRH